ncbi:MAG: LysR family transcriptional regulator substrate-binding protein, partial [Lachnospiraceae bacterium]|nr:LysR family transcriptional regulator substrate-binding protein [Lachnospiraceae bacterium]
PTISMLSNANLMLLDEENISRVYIDEYFKSNDIKPNQILEVSTMDLLIEFAKIGLGLACVIKEFVSEPLETGELLALSLDVPIEKRSIGFVVSKRGTYSKAVQNFLSFVSFPN